MYQTHAEQRKCDVPKCTDERGWHDLRHHEPRRDERSSRDHTDNQGRPKKLPRGLERGATGRAVKEPQSARRSRFQKMSPTNQTLSSTAAASIGYNGSPPAADLLKAAMQKGLVPVVADSATKARRELFVGNTPQGTSERTLMDHLNAAMTLAMLTSAPGSPVIACRLSAAFAFVELRSVEETDRCLNLTGLPFMGASLKIGRPSKYDGPVTTATSWSHILLSLGADAVDGMSPAALVLKAGGADTSLVALENDATKCELFIANLCPESNASTLAAFLEALAVEAAIDVQTGGAIKSVRVSGTYAFLETRSHSDTSALLNFDGVPFRGHRLRICRPTKSTDTNHGTTSGFEDDNDFRQKCSNWAGMLELIRYRRGRCDQNIQNKSDHHSDGFAETKALPLC
ncbi:hypothetical protein AURANDRAFT_55169, partial [Aureococcus anophagefferens]